MKLLEDMTNEEVVNELIYEVETTSKLSESNYFAMVKEELLSRLSNGVANNQFDLTQDKPSQVN